MSRRTRGFSSSRGHGLGEDIASETDGMFEDFGRKKSGVVVYSGGMAEAVWKVKDSLISVKYRNRQ